MIPPEEGDQREGHLALTPHLAGGVAKFFFCALRAPNFSSARFARRGLQYLADFENVEKTKSVAVGLGNS